MDTGTHFVMGIALGGLATLDPVVASDPVTAQTVLIGTILGSQAPDLDTVLKLVNNAAYLRNHRGITHSIPAVLLWPLLISFSIYAFIPETNLLHLWLWTFLAVFLHVFVDIFNAYGTQAIRPLSRKWVALGIINTFDPFIFFIHIIGIIIWRYGYDPGYTFLIMYGVIFVYYLWRTYARMKVKQTVKQKIPDAVEILISPTFRWSQWHVAVKTDEMFYVANVKNNDIGILDSFKKKPVPELPSIQAAKEDKNLSAFLSFSPVYRWVVREYDDFIEVKFIDLRYWSKGHYPFVAVVQLSHTMDIQSSYTGWVFSEEKLRKKLDLVPG
ncbi:metal-dependent hydrolase [Bacillus marinisedimentorum]|uniref:metal-dependent hydrolase n=1 Tax=Bacillus marinisedimentorum TaxID=1821260 RepID=UPI0008727B5F|nr:metal-dependent hydrolase [Bacillus marinisedimentorum]